MTNDRLQQVLQQSAGRWAAKPDLLPDDVRRFAGCVMTAPDGQIYSVTVCEIVLGEESAA